MNRIRYIFMLIIPFSASMLAAQDSYSVVSDSSLIPRYDVSFEYIRQSEAWLTSENTAGLQHLPIRKISSAGVFFNKSDGKFVNYFQSDNSYEWGAQTESFFRLNPKIVFYGKVYYANFAGKNMGGSTFIDPYYNPFDLVELTDDARGEKNKESYRLSGAICAQVHKKWTLGGRIDYRTANYAKYKDLRHTNKFLDLTTTVGATYSFGPKLEAGVNYFYRRSVEDIIFKTYGLSGQMYSTLVNFGAFFGRSELFGSGGRYTNGNNSLPLFNIFHGASLQLNYRFQPQWNLFNEFSCKMREGQYGIKDPYKRIFTEHQGSIFSYTGTLSYRKQDQLHLLHISAEYNPLENKEYISEVLNSTEGYVQDIIYYGSIKMLDKTVFNATITYTANLDVKDYTPVWVLQVGGDFHDRQQKASVYPFYRKQNIYCFNARLQACKNTIVDRKNMYTVSLRALYGSGGGTLYDDGVYQTPSEDQESPATTAFNLYREYEYLTAPRIQGNIGIAYSRLLNPVVRGYIRANCELTNALNTEHIEGKTHGSATLAIGCTF